MNARTLGKRFLLTAELLAAAVSPVLAVTARVPEDFSTIQAAVDHLEQSFDVDTLLVRAGYYPEHVMIREAIRLWGIPAPGSAEPMPRIDELHVQPPSSGDVIAVIGIHVAGPARTAGSDGPDRIYYDSCRFDEGMTGGNWYPDIAIISLRRCALYGTISLQAKRTIVDSCTIHGPTVMEADEAAVVTDNVFETIHGVAATVFSEQAVLVARNDVRGGDSGLNIRGGWDGFVRVEDNRIDGCAGTGIYLYASDSFESTIERNHVTRCSGMGIQARGMIRAKDNRVIGCGSHGMALVQRYEVGLVEGNVVGHCGGGGIILERENEWDTTPYGFRVQGNTVYTCEGSGIVAGRLNGGSITGNIAYANGGYGLLAQQSEAIPATCNDVFANLGGTISGIPLASNNVEIDPQLCDVDHDDVHLRSDSPLLDILGCGRIGALGQGCEAPVVAMGIQVWPPVLQPASRGRHVTATLEPPMPFAVTEIDISSVLVNGVALAGTEAIVGDRDKDGVPDLQLQFDRAALERVLTAGDEVDVTITGRIGRRSFSGTDRIRVLRYTGGPRSEIPRNAAREHVLSIRPRLGATGGHAQVEYTLADESPARLELLDVIGRVVASHEVGGTGPGEHTMELGAGNGLAQGIYFLRLRQGVSEARTRMVVIR